MKTTFILLATVLLALIACVEGEINETINTKNVNEINLNNENLIGHNTPIVDAQDNLFVIMSNELGLGDPECFVYAFNNEKDEMWQTGLSPKATQIAALPNGNIIAKGTHKIYCLAKSNGSELWSKDLLPNAFSKTTTDVAIDKNGNILFLQNGYYDSNFQEYPASIVSLTSAGAINWTKNVALEEIGCHYGEPTNPIISNDKIYFGFRSSLDGKDTKYLMIYNNAGTELFRTETGSEYGPLKAQGADTNGNLYFIHIKMDTDQSALVKCNPSGAVQWSVLFPNILNSDLVIDANNNIYLGCDDQNIYCIDQNGTTKWKADFGIFCRGSFLIGDNNKLYHFQQNVSEIDMSSGIQTTFENSFDLSGGDLGMLSDGNLVLPSGAGLIKFYETDASQIDTAAPWAKKYGNIKNTYCK